MTTEQRAGNPGDLIPRYLQRHGVHHELIAHRRTETAAAEARAAHVPEDQAAKTIVLRDTGASPARSDYVLAVIPATERLDLRKLGSLLGSHRHLRLATEDEMRDAFPSFEVGAVPPLGSELMAEEVVDRELMRRRRVLCSAGDHEHSILLDPQHIVALTRARVGDICLD